MVFLARQISMLTQFCEWIYLSLHFEALLNDALFPFSSFALKWILIHDLVVQTGDLHHGGWQKTLPTLIHLRKVDIKGNAKLVWMCLLIIIVMINVFWLLRLGGFVREIAKAICVALFHRTLLRITQKLLLVILLRLVLRVVKVGFCSARSSIDCIRRHSTHNSIIF